MPKKTPDHNKAALDILEGLAATFNAPDMAVEARAEYAAMEERVEAALAQVLAEDAPYFPPGENIAVWTERYRNDLRDNNNPKQLEKWLSMTPQQRIQIITMRANADLI